MPETYDFPPYKRLSRAEKREFRRIIRVRKASDSPVRAQEYATVADYAQVRSRIEMLTLFVERERCSGGAANYLQACRAVDAAVSLSRRLSRDLGLIEADRSANGGRKRTVSPPTAGPGSADG